jgi:hypothetical protein
MHSGTSISRENTCIQRLAVTTGTRPAMRFASSTYIASPQTPAKTSRLPSALPCPSAATRASTSAAIPKAARPTAAHWRGGSLSRSQIALPTATTAGSVARISPASSAVVSRSPASSARL